MNDRPDFVIVSSRNLETIEEAATELDGLLRGLEIDWRATFELRSRIAVIQGTCRAMKGAPKSPTDYDSNASGQ